MNEAKRLSTSRFAIFSFFFLRKIIQVKYKNAIPKRIRFSIALCGIYFFFLVVVFLVVVFFVEVFDLDDVVGFVDFSALS